MKVPDTLSVLLPHTAFGDVTAGTAAAVASSVRGRRHVLGLPVNGQKTPCNAKTSRKFKRCVWGGCLFCLALPHCGAQQGVWLRSVQPPAMKGLSSVGRQATSFSLHSCIMPTLLCLRDFPLCASWCCCVCVLLSTHTTTGTCCTM